MKTIAFMIAAAIISAPAFAKSGELVSVGEKTAIFKVGDAEVPLSKRQMSRCNRLFVDTVAVKGDKFLLHMIMNDRGMKRLVPIGVAETADPGLDLREGYPAWVAECGVKTKGERHAS